MTIRSFRGPYQVHSHDDLAAVAAALAARGDVHFLVDARVAALHAQTLAPILWHKHVLLIDATEAAKSIDRVGATVELLAGQGARRKHTLVAVGGGIVQDLVCFLASVMFRGMRWELLPTTLLAQADSCIGSKSSINVGAFKNLLGTFWAPQQIHVWPGFLDTLALLDLRSGIGEILKVHIVDGPGSFALVAPALDAMLARNRDVLGCFIHRSLEIKQRFIEEDELDEGVRNLLNYGHSFGHAIETATSFAIPHGVAVTIGMDMANFTSMRRGALPSAAFDRMHAVLRRNVGDESADVRIDLDAFLTAIARDKKNEGGALTLILPNADAHVGKEKVDNDASFRDICAQYFASNSSTGTVGRGRPA